MDQNEKIELLNAIIRTFNYLHPIVHICPNCRKYMIIPGNVCFGCGYDDSKDK